MDYASGDHYQVLGVDRAAVVAEITRAYKVLALRYHPDKNPDRKSEAELSFKRIAEAYAVLRDPKRRREYDHGGGNGSYVSYDEAEQMWSAFMEEGLPAAGLVLGRARLEAETRAKAVGLVVVVVTLLYAPREWVNLLPFVALALGGLSMLFSQALHGGLAPPRWLLAVAGLLALAYARPWRSGGRALQGLRGGAAGQLGAPHSGEDVLAGDSTIVRVADPGRPSAEGGVAAGWQQRLLDSMRDAEQAGQHQVVTVFSRQGCPWCDRQLPILHQALRRRTAPAAAPAAAAPPMLRLPLRVFVIDAGEFPTVAEEMEVEAFPTTVAWGPGGGLRAEGFLDEGAFDALLEEAAAPPPAA